MAEKIIEKSIAKTIKPRYTMYGLSVVEDRALPSVVSGCKPVLKRSLYSMYDMGLTSGAQTKKSAKVVGDVLGRFHAHGDKSVYDAIVRVAQDWNLRYPLVHLQGNKGSIDGDPAAAYRYTEIKLTKYGEQLLRDIKKDTVDFGPNFDNTEQEPVELPAFLPNLFANGTEGIAVGMTTAIPPHNLSELMSAAKRIIANSKAGKETTLEDLMKDIKGPDFPGGGIIVNKKDLKKAFATGKGRVTVRGKVEVREDKKKNLFIDIVELPYQVSPSALIRKIEELKNENKIEGVKEVNNMSDKSMCIEIALKKGANIELVLNKLYKLTRLQENYNYNMNALLEGKPVTVTLESYMEEYLSHCLDVIYRRTQFDLSKSQKRISNILAIESALDNMDEVISIIKESDNPTKDLIELLQINEEQANYIIDMRLRNLTKVSYNKLKEEHEALDKEVAEFNKILNDEEYALDTLDKELTELKEKFGDERRTQIDLTASGEIAEEDLIKDEPLVVTITSDGLIKAVDEKEYSTQKRGGKGTKTANTKNDEVVTEIFSINSKDDILFMSSTGRCHKIKAYKIPKVSKASKGRHINNFINLQEGEEIVSVMSLRVAEEADNSILFITALGRIKRLAIKDLSSKFPATKVVGIREGDALQTCLKVKEGDDVILCTALAQSIRFTVTEDVEITKRIIKCQGRSGTGVQGIKVVGDDYVVGGVVVNNNSNVLTLTSRGLSKQTKGAAWEPQGRGGKGIKCHKITEKTGELVSVLAIEKDDELFVGTESGKIIRLSANSIASSSRASQGTKAIRLDEGDCAFTASLAPKGMGEEIEEEVEESNEE